MIYKVLPHLVLWAARFMRLTCTRVVWNDPREKLRESGNTFIYAGLHAQQTAVLIYGDPQDGAMISRSRDGDLVAKALIKLNVVPIRGSGGPTRKGGAAALKGMVDHVRAGNPGFLAVDGPKGPRNLVRPGAAMLSIKTGQPVIPVALIARRRIILKRTWDRSQIPLPFSKIDGYFGEPLFPKSGETVEELTERIQVALLALHREFDPVEAAISQKDLAGTRRSRRAA